MIHRDHDSGGRVAVMIVVVCRVTIVGFRPITHEGMHQFHLNVTEGSSIIKYRSSSIRGAELWPFFLHRIRLNCQFVVSDQ